MEIRLLAEERTLSEEECFELLASASTGRLAGSHRALPVVMPVGIHLLGDTLAIEPMLDATFPFDVDSVVAIEAGTLGEGLDLEWIVEVQGFLQSTNTTIPRASRAEHAGGKAYWLSVDVMFGWSVERGPNRSRYVEVEGVPK